MSQQIRDSGSHDRRLNIVIGIMALVTLFAPAHAQVAEWGSFVLAMTWQWSVSRWDSYFIILQPYMLIQVLPFTFLRPIFVAMFYRMYKGKSTRKRVLIVGILSEILIEMIYYIPMILSMIMYPWGLMIPLMFPIPLLFLIGLVYMKLVPPPEVTSWVEESEPSYWWTEKEKEKPKAKPEEKPTKKLEERPERKTTEKPADESAEEPVEEESDIWMD